MTIPLLIDTDPGVDDALALLMALAEPAVEIVALTIAAGNVGLDHTVANALKLLEVCDSRVPVYPGAPAPLLHPAEDAAFVHGRDGFGDTGYTPAARHAEAEHAALAMLRLSHRHAGRLQMVMLGPLTNLALALKLDPTLPQRVERLVIMGGAVTGRGNTTVPAEFNIGFDPEAAHVVFSAWPRFDLVDWEATLRHPWPLPEFEGWLAADSPRARFYDAISRSTRAWSAARHGGEWHSADGLAMAVALEPQSIDESFERAVAIELEGRLTRGATIVDWEQRSDQHRQCRIVTRFDPARFRARVQAALAIP